MLRIMLNALRIMLNGRGVSNDTIDAAVFPLSVSASLGPQGVLSPMPNVARTELPGTRWTVSSTPFDRQRSVDIPTPLQIPTPTPSPQLQADDLASTIPMCAMPPSPVSDTSFVPTQTTIQSSGSFPTLPAPCGPTRDLGGEYRSQQSSYANSRYIDPPSWSWYHNPNGVARVPVTAEYGYTPTVGMVNTVRPMENVQLGPEADCAYASVPVNNFPFMYDGYCNSILAY